MAKNQIMIFRIKKNYKKLKKARFALNKKALKSARHAFVRVPRFKGKKPQGLCALHLSALLTTLLQFPWIT